MYHGFLHDGSGVGCERTRLCKHTGHEAKERDEYHLSPGTLKTVIPDVKYLLLTAKPLLSLCRFCQLLLLVSPTLWVGTVITFELYAWTR